MMIYTCSFVTNIYLELTCKSINYILICLNVIMHLIIYGTFYILKTKHTCSKLFQHSTFREETKKQFKLFAILLIFLD